MHKITEPTKKIRNISPYGTDWDYLESATDEDIQRGIDNDPDAAPILSMEQMKKEYKLTPPRTKR